MKNNKGKIKSTISSLFAVILAFAVSIIANTAMAHGRHIPPHQRHPHHAIHHGHGRPHGMAIALPMPLPTAWTRQRSHLRVWVPGMWLEKRDVYGRIVYRRWIPGHWEYR